MFWISAITILLCVIWNRAKYVNRIRQEAFERTIKLYYLAPLNEIFMSTNPLLDRLETNAKVDEE